MGTVSSKPAAEVKEINDFELVIRVSKELEYVLVAHFAASGKGLHEKISSAVGLPPALVRRMRYLATIRNKLIHEYGFDALPDRARFLADFNASRAELAALITARTQQAHGGGSPAKHGARGGGAVSWSCAIM